MSVGALVHFIFYDLLALFSLGVEPIHPSEHSANIVGHRALVLQLTYTFQSRQLFCGISLYTF